MKKATLLWGPVLVMGCAAALSARNRVEYERLTRDMEKLSHQAGLLEQELWRSGWETTRMDAHTAILASYQKELSEITDVLAANSALLDGYVQGKSFGDARCDGLFTRCRVNAPRDGEKAANVSALKPR